MVNAKELSKVLKDNQVVFINYDLDNFKIFLQKLASKLWSEYDKMSIVCFRYPYATIDSILKKTKVKMSDVCFVDVLTNTVKKTKSTRSVEFINSPSNLTDIGIACSEFLKKSNVIIVNNIANLKTFTDEERVMKFMEALVNKVRIADKKIVFIEPKDHAGRLREKLLNLTDHIFKE